ncbi:MAG: DUF2161 family putative PD-(D/E)XK-type phosphodiesterase [Pseudomonadota bacterium]
MADGAGIRAQATLRETDLYAPVKALLERQGYTVKGEVGAADVVAVRDGEPPVIVELKRGFSLALLHQAVARQAITDAVYVAVPRSAGRAATAAFRANLGLCRRLGLGVITVRLADGATEIPLDPAPYRPRKSPKQQARLLREFVRRVGDPNAGGASRTRIMTAYRQDALRCVAHLISAGPSKASIVASATGVATARRLMADDHYGWFERTARGIYALTPKGQAVPSLYGEEIARLAREAEPQRDCLDNLE